VDYDVGATYDIEPSGRVTVHHALKAGAQIGPGRHDEDKKEEGRATLSFHGHRQPIQTQGREFVLIYEPETAKFEMRRLDALVPDVRDERAQGGAEGGSARRMEDGKKLGPASWSPSGAKDEEEKEGGKEGGGGREGGLMAPAVVLKHKRVQGMIKQQKAKKEKEKERERKREEKEEEKRKKMEEKEKERERKREEKEEEKRKKMEEKERERQRRKEEKGVEKVRKGSKPGGKGGMRKEVKDGEEERRGETRGAGEGEEKDRQKTAYVRDKQSAGADLQGGTEEGEEEGNGRKARVTVLGKPGTSDRAGRMDKGGGGGGERGNGEVRPQVAPTGAPRKRGRPVGTGKKVERDPMPVKKGEDTRNEASAVAEEEAAAAVLALQTMAGGREEVDVAGDWEEEGEEGKEGEEEMEEGEDEDYVPKRRRGVK
jgi:hypothetical protein